MGCVRTVWIETEGNLIEQEVIRNSDFYDYLFNAIHVRVYVYYTVAHKIESMWFIDRKSVYLSEYSIDQSLTYHCENETIMNLYSIIGR